MEEDPETKEERQSRLDQIPLEHKQRVLRAQRLLFIPVLSECAHGLYCMTILTGSAS